MPKVEQAARDLAAGLAVLDECRQQERVAASKHANLRGIEGGDLIGEMQPFMRLPGHVPFSGAGGQSTSFREPFGKSADALDRWLSFHRPAAQNGRGRR